MKRHTIVLATYGDSRKHEHGDCMDTLQHELGVLVMTTRRSSQIDMARSHLATVALGHGADVVVFIDHDILFDPLDVERLAEVAREVSLRGPGPGVVGVPYAQRAMGAGVVGGLDPEVPEVVFYEGGGLYPATGVIGMGFTAIHREVFEKLDVLPEYSEVMAQEGLLRPYFKKLVVNGYWLKEDASFCHAARQVGASTLLDTRIRVKHDGSHPFGIEDCLKPAAQAPTLRVKTRSV